MGIPRFDWNDLRYFLAVARSGTISLAGRRTGADHATVGRRIAALERALGLKLFERNPRGYILTRQGETVLAIAAGIEDDAAQIEEIAAGRPLGLAGSVRISAPEGFGNFFLAPRIGALTDAHPELTVEMITIQQIVALSRREADVAVTMALPSGGDFQHEHLTDYILHVYGTREYLAKSPPIRARADLGLHRFIGYVDDLIFTRALDYLPEIRPHLHARLQNSSLHAQLQATIAGHGLCVLPAYVAVTQPQLVPVLRKEVALRRSYWMVVNSDIAGTAPVRVAQRFLRAQMADAPAMFLPGEDVGGAP